MYGYEAQTMRNNVRYTSSDEVVYTVSTMGVVLNTGNKAQRIYKVGCVVIFSCFDICCSVYKLSSFSLHICSSTLMP